MFKFIQNPINTLLGEIEIDGKTFKGIEPIDAEKMNKWQYYALEFFAIEIQKKCIEYGWEYSSNIDNVVQNKMLYLNLTEGITIKENLILSTLYICDNKIIALVKDFDFETYSVGENEYYYLID